MCSYPTDMVDTTCNWEPTFEQEKYEIKTIHAIIYIFIYVVKTWYTASYFNKVAQERLGSYFALECIHLFLHVSLMTPSFHN